MKGNTMNKKEVLNTVLRIAEQVTKVDASEVSLETSLLGEMDLNSLEILVILIEVEKYYSIKVPETEYKRLVTVGDYVDLIIKYKK